MRKLLQAYFNMKIAYINRLKKDSSTLLSGENEILNDIDYWQFSRIIVSEYDSFNPLDQIIKSEKSLRGNIIGIGILSSDRQIDTMALTETLVQQMNIITSSLNGESLEKYLTDSEGNYMNYSDIASFIRGNGNQKEETDLFRLCELTISEYIHQNNIQLPQVNDIGKAK